ncbi:solute carrier family 35 member B1 [Xenopus laevis]|uniref:Solute carrier family 35 member B1 n=1 Tax=Xenopus laevis TaxID=8355 RepID=A0A8J0U037_XENLA|nr:solute carrier family 35 member B1 [Xenopus laevis]
MESGDKGTLLSDASVCGDIMATSDTGSPGRGPCSVRAQQQLCMRAPPAERDVRLDVPVTSTGGGGAAAGDMTSAGSQGSGGARLLVCFLGVFVCYFYYGILQETITRGTYGEGEKQEKFRFALSLVFVQCIVNALFAKLLIQFFDSGKTDRTQSWLYAVCSLSYLGAMVSSNSALQFVNYPTQVLGKSCKPIPVMLLGVTLLRKKYPLTKYLCVLLIVLGVALFMYKPKKTDSGGDDHAVGFGELLLLLSLTLDGLTGVSQDHMRAHFQTGSNHMMLNINMWSSLFLGAGIVFTGELWEFLSFTERYPSIVYNILLFSLTSALGQTFIFMTVVYFGPLTCSIITTTRKFFTILASVILFSNPISSIQWVGTILVFLGLGLDATYGKGSKKPSH